MSSSDPTRPSRDETQEDYFSNGGGDDYFARNESLQGEPTTEHPAFQLLLECAGTELPSRGSAVVVGGAGGREAAGLKRLLPSWRISNIDISQRAIDFGRVRFPEVHHHCASITSGSPDVRRLVGEQDLIFVVAVLHWIDRSRLSRAIANLDAALRDGGRMLITDFSPPSPRKNPIRHSPQHFTYKQNYPNIFLALGTYETEASESIVVDEPRGASSDDRTIATHVLRKRLTSLYPVGTFS